MKWKEIQQNWDKIKPRVRERWARLAPSEIDEIGGQREDLIDRIQNAYRIGQEEAEQQVQEFETKVDPKVGWDGPAGPGRRTD